MNPFDEYRLKARGRLAVCREIINAYGATAEAAKRWMPARTLRSQCRVALELLEKMEERLDRKLIVTLIGPSGAGKSTLLNALAEDDTLSPTGIRRPTTQEIVLFCRDSADADVLFEALGSRSVSVRTGPKAAQLENVVLVDTPDMDSTESEKFHPVLEKIIAVTDVLVCVLSAENPKRRDTIVFLKRFVDFYPGHLLYVVLNRCDRIREEELKNLVLPDLHRHLHTAWHRPLETVLCVSARNHLKNPNWPEDETPLHRFDEYERLHDLIFGSDGQGGRFVDARVERAEHLVTLIRNAAHDRLAGVKEGLLAVKKEILEMEKRASASANQGIREAGAEMMTGIQAMFYQKLAGRWWGPVGWLVAFWARFLMAGAGMMAALRFGNPVVQIWGLLSALVRFRKTRSAVEEAAAGGDLAPVLLKYRFKVQRSWPEIAQKLVALGFDASVRDARTVLPEEKVLTERLTSSWKTTLEAVMDRRAAGVSGFFLQFIFNLPTLAIMALFAYQSVDLFLRQQILPSGYFLHATVSIVLVWLLSFVLLQVIVRFVSGKSLLDRTFARLLKEIDRTDGEPLSRSIIGEIDAVLGLDD